MKRQRIDDQSVKVTRETLRQLRVIVAMKGERQYQVLARLVQGEYARVLQEEQRRSHED